MLQADSARNRLVGIGLVLTPIKNGMVLLSLHMPIFTGDAWEH